MCNVLEIVLNGRRISCHLEFCLLAATQKLLSSKNKDAMLSDLLSLHTAHSIPYNNLIYRDAKDTTDLQPL